MPVDEGARSPAGHGNWVLVRDDIGHGIGARGSVAQLLPDMEKLVLLSR